MLEPRTPKLFFGRCCSRLRCDSFGEGEVSLVMRISLSLLLSLAQGEDDVVVVVALRGEIRHGFL